MRLTENDVYNVYEFKLIKKILKREFKWIKDLKLVGDPNRYSTLIFLRVVLDPWEFAETEGFTVARYMSKNRPEIFGGLAVFLTESTNNPILKEIENEIENIPKQVHDTKILPIEHKLKDRRFDINEYSYEP